MIFEGTICGSGLDINEVNGRLHPRSLLKALIEINLFLTDANCYQNSKT
jgi:hypothetical protein